MTDLVFFFSGLLCLLLPLLVLASVGVWVLLSPREDEAT